MNHQFSTEPLINFMQSQSFMISLNINNYSVGLNSLVNWDDPPQALPPTPAAWKYKENIHP